MIYFCADDYGISAESNSRIEHCLEKGVLNMVSVLPNGDIDRFKSRLCERNAHISLHINLVEGRPLSDTKDVSLLVTPEGFFRYSFVGLFLKAMSPWRKEFKKQIHREIQSQIRFFKEQMGDTAVFSVDSHQHTHMIPMIFRTLTDVIKEEGLAPENIRFPDEPILPYLLTPSLYLSYISSGIIKQWLLKFLGVINRKELKKSGIDAPYFMGIMFSGRLNEKNIRKVLPRYIKLADKHNKNIEIALHPGFVHSGERMIEGARKDFCRFYYSPGRKAEYDAMLNLKF